MQREPVEAYIGLGANLGDPMAALRQALGRLAELPHTVVLRASGLYGSTPVDSSGPDYVNAVACVRTRLTAPALLSALQAQENQAGRERPYRNAPRTLDLDVLLYGSARMAGPVLTVPHPRMTERAFVLMPLAEIAPDLVSATQLAAVRDQGIWRLAG
ncbi:2-amino-4-hydroxy-6-hydroxymethyldihydropteridine diphosphokinase [Rhodoferax sp. TBRC 17660]|uniref:2-amino-4-hydroxy-6-hydroxymethyldihydropteridine pyrophosphokinase n=1 Tax=Rhodoferax potami TaxID=3068338 RepID=A0ABU3KJA6_9BURK|nr:2-amino-4-hydroxy-6-hydroxymethyldihydropteridine diphosphokinase [Rhodoferax sp. TBRC 17660]MDT7517641.1 2-amino-4-hydroxy-6-hydroxymethyldihydropteridine diphosphokinase [Rhodoferax sp. TBRC 17660]